MLYPMAAVVKPRPYNSPTRRTQLTATKAAIIEAARELVVKNGYEATTMEQIAARTGVAVQTVYKHFGTKPAIVRAFIEQARQDPRLVEQRRRLLEEPDPREQVGLFAQRARLHAELGAHTASALRARAQDPDLAKNLRQLAVSVRRSHLEYARSLERKGALRTGITVEQAADYMLLGDPDKFLALRRDKGWSFDQCEAWLADVLTRLLLD
ncbi:MAG: TetR/AcrR family transcriptional regulator [Chloroflexi bacterium]|nr:MAG: TetR/AcrR family transcriptional regulator [Chloroflexota bacterium]